MNLTLATSWFRRSARHHFSAQLCLERLEARTLLDMGMRVGPNINISPYPGSGTEDTIAVNPTNPQNIFAASTTATVDHRRAFRFSMDGGNTWSDTNMTGLQAYGGDNQASFDGFGNLFVTCFDTAQKNVLVLLSADGGKSFRQLAGFPAFDQPSIATGPGGNAPGSVWITYASAGNIRAVGAPVFALNDVGSFVSPVDSLNSYIDNFGGIAVGPQGQVAVTYMDAANNGGPSKIYVDTINGLGSKFNGRVLVTTTNVGGLLKIPAQPSRGIDAEPNLAYDHTQNLLYLVYVDRPSLSSTNTNIFFRASTDGVHFGPAIQVNDDAGANSHFNPAIAVDQTTEEVAITWYDCRNSPRNNTAEIFGTVGTANPQGFLPNVEIGAGLCNGAADVGFDFGDYDTMDFVNGTFYRVWADNSNPSEITPPNRNLPGQELAFDAVNVYETQPVVALLVTADPTTIVAGSTFSVTVTALDASGQPNPNYTGTVHFGSSDAFATLPADYTFTLGDNGVHIFAGVVLTTAGNATISVADTGVSSIAGSVTELVTPAPADHFAITAPATVTSGAAFDLTVTALDPFGNVDTNYQGTVTFTSTDTDPGVVLPADYTFQASDQGVHLFASGASLITPGIQTIFVTDTATGITGSVDVLVQAAPPPGPAGPGGALHAIDLVGATVSALMGSKPVVLARPVRTENWMAQDLN